MKKVYLSFAVMSAFAIFATFSRQNVGIGIDRYLSPNVSVLKNDATSSGIVPNPNLTPVAVSNPQPTPAQRVVTRIFGGEDEGEGEDGRRAVSPISAPAPTKTSTPTPAPVTTKTTSSGQYKDGSYIGSVADAYYGNIQVKAVIQNGKLADVVFLQYPSDRGTSVAINTQAMPYLKSEAISAQSSSVNIVSGATDSSIAFKESLSNALSQALN